jgi:hypothetical protein
MAYEKYNIYLNGVVEFDNYWSDFGIFDAINVLDKFSNEDWVYLERELMEKKSIWIISCLETLSEIKDKKSAFRIIEKLLNHADGEVVLAAMDAMNGMISDREDYPGEISNLIKILDKKVAIENRIELVVINSLKQKIGK